ncbi:MAG: hypothetical protein L0216_08305 [Planctomycetales bacterium]|nr:hypothetical protein [Planctomycetales bacterium]
MDAPDPLTSEEARRRARRKVLRLAGWTVPAILGTFAVSRSAGAVTCAPCQPSQCEPARRNCKPRR